MNNQKFSFTQEILAEAIHIWECAGISLVDIQHNIISPEAAVCHYTMPASTFVYTCGGAAEISLDNYSFHISRFGLFHGGKGTVLSIQPTGNWLEYYMIMYQADEPASNKKEYLKLLIRTNPFRQQYGFTPDNPIFFSEQLHKMYEHWSEPSPLHLFYEKSAFYQFVYEIYRELYKRNVYVLQPDIVAMARRYLYEHYNQAISLHDLCGILGVSTGHLRSTFKSKYGCSPQEYIINLRIQKAKRYLIHSDFKLKEIAAYTGFYDEYHMSRLFKKHEGISPLSYKSKYTLNTFETSIGNSLFIPYSGDCQVSDDKLRKEGAIYMFKQMKNKVIIAAALSLLLTACSTNMPGNTSGLEPTAAPTATTQTPETNNTASTEGTTKTIQTIMGEVEVPVNPEKIAVWVYEQELFSLGIKPVSISAGTYENVWSDLPVLSYSPDKEELISLEPDLLITYDDVNFFNEYKDIAPVITIPLDTAPEDTLTFLGEVLNLSDEAQKVIDNFTSTVETAKSKITQEGLLGKTVVLIEPAEDKVWIYDNAYGRGGSILYNYLGFEIPEIVKKEFGDKHYMNVSFELLPQYCDADYIVVVTGDGYTSLKQNAVWKSIPAVKENHIIEFDAGVLGGRGLDIETLDHFTNSFLSDNTKK